MDDVAEEVANFIRRARVLGPGVTTREVVAELRAHLDAGNPEWRWDVFEDGPDGARALEVEFRLRGGRVIRAALVQRPSAVSGGAE